MADNPDPWLSLGVTQARAPGHLRQAGVRTGGRNGTCDISVRIVSRMDFGALSQTGRVSGESCGNTVDMDLRGPMIPEG